MKKNVKFLYNLSTSKKQERELCSEDRYLVIECLLDISFFKISILYIFAHFYLEIYLHFYSNICYRYLVIGDLLFICTIITLLCILFYQNCTFLFYHFYL